MYWPQRGVYFFMEDGEERSDSGSGLRIVRVGTHQPPFLSGPTRPRRRLLGRDNPTRSRSRNYTPEGRLLNRPTCRAVRHHRQLSNPVRRLRRQCNHRLLLEFGVARTRVPRWNPEPLVRGSNPLAEPPSAFFRSRRLVEDSEAISLARIYANGDNGRTSSSTFQTTATRHGLIPLPSCGRVRMSARHGRESCA